MTRHKAERPWHQWMSVRNKQRLLGFAQHNPPQHLFTKVDLKTEKFPYEDSSGPDHFTMSAGTTVPTDGHEFGRTYVVFEADSGPVPAFGSTDGSFHLIFSGRPEAEAAIRMLRWAADHLEQRLDGDAGAGAEGGAA